MALVNFTLKYFFYHSASDFSIPYKYPIPKPDPSKGEQYLAIVGNTDVPQINLLGGINGGHHPPPLCLPPAVTSGVTPTTVGNDSYRMYFPSSLATIRQLGNGSEDKVWSPRAITIDVVSLRSPSSTSLQSLKSLQSPSSSRRPFAVFQRVYYWNTRLLIRAAQGTEMRRNSMSSMYVMAIVAAKLHCLVTIPSYDELWNSAPPYVLNKFEAAMQWLWKGDGLATTTTITIDFPHIIQSIRNHERERCFYRLALLAIYLRYYVVACYFLRLALVTPEEEYNELFHRAYGLRATLWLCCILQHKLCDMLGVSEAEREN